jgi:hypothetical protein
VATEAGAAARIERALENARYNLEEVAKATSLSGVFDPFALGDRKLVKADEIQYLSNLRFNLKKYLKPGSSTTPAERKAQAVAGDLGVVIEKYKNNRHLSWQDVQKMVGEILDKHWPGWRDGR